MRAARFSFLIAVLTASFGASATADPIAGVAAFNGNQQRVEMHFGDDYHLFVDSGGLGGPLIEVVDEAPYVFSGTTGRGGKQLVLSHAGSNICFLDDDDDWLLSVDASAGFANLVSAEPGCAGSLTFEGAGGPGVAVNPSISSEPDARGATISVGLTQSRWASASGSLAGITVDDYHWARITYTQLFELGGGLVPA